MTQFIEPHIQSKGNTMRRILLNILPILALAFRPHTAPLLAEPLDRDALTTIRIYLDTGGSMFSNGELSRVASRLPEYFKHLIRGDSSWKPLPSNTRLLVYAVCSRNDEIELSPRLVYRMGDPRAPDYSTPPYGDRIRRFRDDETDLSLLLNRHLWPHDSQSANTINVIVSNSRKSPLIDEDLNRAIADSGSMIVTVAVPRTLRGDRLGSRLDRELERAFEEVRRSLRTGSLRRQATWTVLPKEGPDVWLGIPKAFTFQVQNNTDLPIQHIACKISGISGQVRNYLLRGGSLGNLGPGESRNVEFTVSIQEHDGPSSDIAVSFFAAVPSDTNVEIVPATLVVPLRIRQPLRPSAQFRAEPSRGIAPLTVRFINESQDSERYAWSFGDGATSSSASPTHRYERAGTYSVKLSAHGDHEAVDEAERQVVVEELVPPEAAFTVSTDSGYAPLTINLASTSKGAAQIEWTANNQKSTSALWRVTFDQPGEYPVRLTVRDERGGEDTAVKTITVRRRPELRLEVFPGDDRSVEVVPKAPGSTSIRLDFGDGHTIQSATDGEFYTHTFTRDGEYRIVMTATLDGEEKMLEESVTVSTTKPPPTAAFEISLAGRALETGPDGSYKVKTGQIIDFTNRSRNAQRYVWSFGDGSSSVTDRNPNHAYDTEGEYTIALTVYCEENTSSTERVSLRVTAGGRWIPALVLLAAAVLVVFGVAWLRRPHLAISVRRDGHEGGTKGFDLFGHRAMIPDLLVPIECKARKVDDLWQVEFRSTVDCVLERLPSQTPMRLEAGVWTDPISPGEFTLAGKPDTVIQIQGE